jgi:GTPase SAR1 family protein
MSFSSSELDYKVDPIRGKAKNVDEQPHEIASREALEETEDLLRLDLALQGLPQDKSGLYFVFVSGDHFALDAATIYDSNRPLPVPAERPRETVGLVWLECDKNEGLLAPHGCPRLASQTLKVSQSIASSLKRNEAFIAGLPVVSLKRLPPDAAGRVSFVAAGDASAAAVSSSAVSPPSATPPLGEICVHDNWRLSGFSSENFRNFDSASLWDWRKDKLVRWPEDRDQVIKAMGRAYSSYMYSGMLRAVYPTFEVWMTRTHAILFDGAPYIPTRQDILQLPLPDFEALVESTKSAFIAGAPHVSVFGGESNLATEVAIAALYKAASDGLRSINGYQRAELVLEAFMSPLDPTTPPPPHMAAHKKLNAEFISYKASVASALKELHPSRRFRIVLLGNSEVGKTSTVDSLSGKPFRSQKGRTDGLVDVTLSTLSATTNDGSSSWKEERPKTRENVIDGVLEHVSISATKSRNGEYADTQDDAQEILSPKSSAVASIAMASSSSSFAPASPAPTTPANFSTPFPAPVLLSPSTPISPSAARPDPDSDQVLITIWDSAGQEQFRDMHHILVSNRSVYLVVFKASEFQKDPDQTSRTITEWIDSVKLRAAGARIIVVGTHSSDVDNADLLDRFHHLVDNVTPVEKGNLDLSQDSSIFGPILIDNYSSVDGAGGGIRVKNIDLLRWLILEVGRHFYLEERPVLEDYFEALLLERREQGNHWVEESAIVESVVASGLLEADACAPLFDKLHGDGVIFRMHTASKHMIILNPVSLITNVVKYFLPMSEEIQKEREAQATLSETEELLRKWRHFAGDAPPSRKAPDFSAFGIQRRDSPLLIAVLDRAKIVEGVAWDPIDILNIMVCMEICVLSREGRNGADYVFPAIKMSKATTLACNITEPPFRPYYQMPLEFKFELTSESISKTDQFIFPITLFRVLVCRLFQMCGDATRFLKDGATFEDDDNFLVLEWNPGQLLFSFRALLYSKGPANLYSTRGELQATLGLICAKYAGSGSGSDKSHIVITSGLRNLCTHGCFMAWDSILAARSKGGHQVGCPGGERLNIDQLFIPVQSVASLSPPSPATTPPTFLPGPSKSPLGHDTDPNNIPFSDLKIDLKDKLGEGSFGKVYKGLYNRSSAAIKVINMGPVNDHNLVALRKDLNREARALMILSSKAPSSAVKFYGVCDDRFEGHPFLAIVTELVEGTLGELFKSERQLPARDCTEATEKIALCLKALHTADAGTGRALVHGDLKPENIFMRRHAGVNAPLTDCSIRDLDVVLGDFGLCTGLGLATASAAGLGGTFHYLAPELLGSNRGAKATPASDLYSLGVIIWQMICNKTPWTDQADIDSFDNLRGFLENTLCMERKPLPFPYDLPTEYDGLVLLANRCMSIDPKDRPTAHYVVLKLLDLKGK